MARRAKSYSDFYSVVRAHLKKEKALEKKKSKEDITTEVELAEWYGTVNDELLEVSHEEYRYVWAQRAMLGIADWMLLQTLPRPASHDTKPPRKRHL